MTTSEQMRRFTWLEDEVRTVAETLDLCDDLIGQMKFATNTKHALEPLLATGFERLAKLTFGLIVEDQDGHWPGGDVRGFRHRIFEIHKACVRLILARLEHGANVNFIVATEIHLRSDPVAELLLRRAEGYARRDRYYNLDALGSGTTSYSPSTEFWAEIDRLSVPICLDGGIEEDEWRQRRRDLMHSALRRIRTFYYQSWAQGVCGPEAKQLAWTLRGRASSLYPGE